MNFKEMLDFTAYQCGSMGSEEGIDDMDPDAYSLISNYVNEGVRVLTIEYWKPYAIEQTTLDSEGNIDESALQHTIVDLIKASSTKEGIGRTSKYSPAINPLEQSVSITESFKPNQSIWIKYRYCDSDLVGDGDTPTLPSIYHNAVCDYATWRYMSTGNSDKQGRANFFYGKFRDAANAVKKYGESSYISNRFINLHTR